jgi:hypothetical protein
MTVQPEVRWVEEPFSFETRTLDGRRTRWEGTIGRLIHDGPCVFVDGQCSCGLLDLGVVDDWPTSGKPVGGNRT